MILDLKIGISNAVDVPVFYGNADCAFDCVTYTYASSGNDGTLLKYTVLVKSLSNSVERAKNRLDTIRSAVIDRSGQCPIRSRKLRSVVELEAMPGFVDEQGMTVENMKLMITGKFI